MYQTRSSILSPLKSVISLLVVLVLGACGFHPLYENHEREGSKVCGNFTVDKITKYDVSGEKLQYELQDLLNEACISTDKNYLVVLNITKTKEGIGIQRDREITRYNIHYVTSFTLKDKEADKIVYHGTSIMVGGYDAQVSDYGTYALEKDTERKLFDETAYDISMKISNTLKQKEKSQ